MLHMHESLGGAFPKRHHVGCGGSAMICKVPVLGRHNGLYLDQLGCGSSTYEQDMRW
jgi:hypothetical protein